MFHQLPYYTWGTVLTSTSKKRGPLSYTQSALSAWLIETLPGLWYLFISLSVYEGATSLGGPLTPNLFSKGKIMPKLTPQPVILTILAIVFVPAASAHMHLMVPSTDMAAPGGTVEFEIMYTHPMTGGPVINMDAPERFGLLLDGEEIDLTGALETTEVDERQAFTAEYEIAEPGAHVFFLDTAPREGHGGVVSQYHLKVVVDSLGAHSGWDASVGAPLEIDPLSRPYGLWTGNLFRGVVRHKGEPVSGALVTIEHNNVDGVELPGDAFMGQVVKTDANGVFAYTIPCAGWWGFSVTLEGDEEVENSQGDMVPMRHGAIMWVHAHEME